MPVSVTVTLDLSRPRGRRRRAMALAVVLGLVLALPIGVFAAHRFTDVPTSHTFHGNIDNLADAGITVGCSPTTFCPEGTLTRAQMAAFLNRGLGRVATKVVAAQPSSGGEITVGTVSITPGTPPSAPDGATQFILVRFDGHAALTTTAGCPCTFAISLPGGQYVYQTFTSSLHYEAMSASVVVMAEGAGTVDLDLKAAVLAGATNGFQIGGTLTAITLPYGPDGSSSLGTGS